MRAWLRSGAIIMLGVLLAGCAVQQSQPLLALDAPSGQGRDLRVVALAVGERLRWRTREGASGEGALIAVTADSLVLDARPDSAWNSKPREVRLALADLSELSHRDPRTGRYLRAAVGIPLIAASLTLIVIVIALDHRSPWVF